jgi:hypothetical protein
MDDAETDLPGSGRKGRVDTRGSAERGAAMAGFGVGARPSRVRPRVPRFSGPEDPGILTTQRSGAKDDGRMRDDA